MHENEKENAQIDVIAAGINHQAAQLAVLADERIRSAQSSKLLADSSLFRPANEDPVEREARVAALQDELDAATTIADEATRIRDATAVIQKLARRRAPAVF